MKVRWAPAPCVLSPAAPRVLCQARHLEGVRLRMSSVEEGIISGEALKKTKEQSPTGHTAAAFLGNVCPLKICVYRYARVPASLSSG